MQEDPAQQSAPSSTAPPQPPAAASEGIPIAEKVERLSKIVSSRTLEGWIVIDRNDREPSAVLMLPGKPVNHVLHFLISVFTCGIWLIVWAILALTAKSEQRMRLSIDNYGNLLEEKISVG